MSQCLCAVPVLLSLMLHSHSRSLLAKELSITLSRSWWCLISCIRSLHSHPCWFVMYTTTALSASFWVTNRNLTTYFFNDPISSLRGQDLVSCAAAVPSHFILQHSTTLGCPHIGQKCSGYCHCLAEHMLYSTCIVVYCSKYQTHFMWA